MKLGSFKNSLGARQFGILKATTSTETAVLKIYLFI